jgi:hypothetical protein
MRWSTENIAELKARLISNVGLLTAWTVWLLLKEGAGAKINLLRCRMRCAVEECQSQAVHRDRTLAQPHLRKTESRTA